ncbi:adiponectin receptor protein 2 isoform X1 [Tachysurus ichikawai]
MCRPARAALCLSHTVTTRRTVHHEPQERTEEEEPKNIDEGFMGMTPLLQAHHAMEKMEEFVHKVNHNTHTRADHQFQANRMGQTNICSVWVKSLPENEKSGLFASPLALISALSRRSITARASSCFP